MTFALLREVRDLQDRVTAYLNESTTAKEDIQYLVAASATPRVFNLGGDLDLFIRLISARDHDGLYEYGHLCVETLYKNFTNLGIHSLTTVSLVQGQALGGGLEGALGNNVLIAERNAQLGFPEIHFNLFPGMGAYSLLSRRIDPIRAEQLLRSGAQHSAEEMWKLGIVDVLAPDGEGIRIANEFMRQHSHSRNGLLAIQQVRQRVNPLAYQELLDVVEIWVDTALRLTTRDLRMMTRLVSAQERLGAEEAEPEAAAA